MLAIDSRHRRRREPSLAFLVATLLLPVAATSAGANGAVLDPIFGAGGKLRLAFNVAGDFDDNAFAVALQPDGKAVVAGSVQVGTTDRDFAVVRLDADGTFDGTFGNGDGVVTVPFDLGQSLQDFGRAIAVQPDGKIVVVGYGETAVAGNFDLEIARLLPDGDLDSSFSGDGKQTVAFDLGGGGFDYAEGVVLQPDGKIVIVGSAQFSATDYDCLAVRLLPDGSLDASFSDDGKQTVPFDLGGLLRDDCKAVGLQSDGRLIIGGSAQKTASQFDMVVARLLASGSLDGSFGSGGRRVIDLGGSEIGNDLTVQADDKIVIVGSTSVFGDNDFAVARLDANGAFDAAFPGGVIVLPFNLVSPGGDIAQTVAVQPDGRILIGGDVAHDLATNDDFGFVRLLPTGHVDTEFAPAGRAVVGFDGGGGDRDALRSVVVRPDGRILAAGFSHGPGADDYDFALLQFIGGPFFADGFESGSTSGWSSVVP